MPRWTVNRSSPCMHAYLCLMCSHADIAIRAGHGGGGSVVSIYGLRTQCQLYWQLTESEQTSSKVKHVFSTHEMLPVDRVFQRCFYNRWMPNIYSGWKICHSAKGVSCHFYAMSGINITAWTRTFCHFGILQRRQLRWANSFYCAKRNIKHIVSACWRWSFDVTL